MKNKLLFTLALNAFSALAIAQTSNVSEPYDQYFTVGPMLGVNFSNFKGVDNAETKAGLNAGAFFVYSFQEHFGLSAGLLYSVEGAEYTTTSVAPLFTEDDKLKTKLNYLRIPVLANVFFGQHGNIIRPKVFLGPSLGFLLGAESKTESTVNNNSVVSTNNTTTDVKDQFSSIDFGAVLGAGLNWKLAEETWLNLDLGYYLGASDIRDKKPSGTDAIKNEGASVKLGVGFGL
jgi:hypothetical protein